jgi:hypothetical protein
MKFPLQLPSKCLIQRERMMNGDGRRATVTTFDHDESAPEGRGGLQFDRQTGKRGVVFRDMV